MGIVGFGQLAQDYYVPALRKLGLQRDVCVADPLESSRAACARAFGAARIYTDYRLMLESEGLRAVLVAAPPSLHLEVWRAVSRLGIPVFMEKPFLLADELEQIAPADPAWQNLMVNFNRRFWPAYRSLAEHVANGSLGRIRGAHFVLEVDARRWSRVSDHRVRAGEGGALHDLGSQVLDLVLWTFGRQPAGISARRTGTGGLDERFDLALSFAGGFVVDCRLAYGRRNRESVTIEGDKATLQLRDPNFLPWCVRDPSSPVRFARIAADFAALGYRGIFRSRSMLRYTVGAALALFFQTAGTSRPFSPGFGDALQVARCTAVAARSLASGAK